MGIQEVALYWEYQVLDPGMLLDLSSTSIFQPAALSSVPAMLPSVPAVLPSVHVVLRSTVVTVLPVVQ